jgi:hypothetical protein
MSLSARVFISCGQAKGTDEVEIAKEIAFHLKELGYDPYIAVEEQSLRGVKENIFQRLKESEYFIFIDFKRERLSRIKESHEDTYQHRGSLFSHQELAIATFLDHQVLAFQEEGLKKDDGILGYIQANCIPFQDRTTLSSLVIEKVRNRSWMPNWRNEIILDRDENYFEVARSPNEGVGNWYHIKVTNNHLTKIANNCIAFVEKITNLTTNEIRILDYLELKWKGVIVDKISIPPGTYRFLDAFHVNFSNPSIAWLGLNPFIVDWQGYRLTHNIIGPGTFDIQYIVFSDGFSPIRTTFRLHIVTNIQDIQFTSI